MKIVVCISVKYLICVIEYYYFVKILVCVGTSRLFIIALLDNLV